MLLCKKKNEKFLQDQANARSAEDVTNQESRPTDCHKPANGVELQLNLPKKRENLTEYEHYKSRYSGSNPLSIYP
jgi:hypothetical protein